MPWFSRVPSLSNLADLPSRDVGHKLLPISLKSSHESVAEVVAECLRGKALRPLLEMGGGRGRKEMGEGRGRKAGGMNLPSTK